MNNKKQVLRCMVIRFKGGPERCEKGLPQKIFIGARRRNQLQRERLFKVEAVK